MARSIAELGAAIATVKSRLPPPPLVSPKVRRLEPGPDPSTIPLVDTVRFRTFKSAFEMLAIVAGLYGIYLAVEETRIASASQHDQARMTAFQLLYTDNVNAVVKLDALQSLAETERSISGFSIVCSSYRTCFDYENLTFEDIGFSDGSIMGTRLFEHSFVGVTFERMAFAGTLFYAGNMEGVLFMESNLNATSFPAEEAYGIDVVAGYMVRADLTGGSFKEAYFPATEVTGMILCSSISPDWLCATGLTPETFEASYFIDEPPSGVRHIPELTAAMIWQCPASARSKLPGDPADYGSYGCVRTALGGRPPAR